MVVRHLSSIPWHWPVIEICCLEWCTPDGWAKHERYFVFMASTCIPVSSFQRWWYNVFKLVDRLVAGRIMSSFSSTGSIYRSLRFRPSVWERREGYRRVAGEGFIRFSFPSFSLPLTSLLLLSPLPLGSLSTQSILIVFLA